MLHHLPVEYGLRPVKVVVREVGVYVEEPIAAGDVDALPELAREQIDAHDREDEPEDQAHHQHVEDRRNRPDQSVYNYLTENDKRRVKSRGAPYELTS